MWGCVDLNSQTEENELYDFTLLVLYYLFNAIYIYIKLRNIVVNLQKEGGFESPPHMFY